MQPSGVFGPILEDPSIAVIFSEEQWVENMLQAEVALANAQGKLGVIPQDAALAIARGMDGFRPNLERLRAGTKKAGFPVIGLLMQLKEQLGPEAGHFLHWGATTQDIMDTATVLQIRAACSRMERMLAELIKTLAALAEKHRTTLMAGRTHSQQALPITFGFKVACWLDPLLRHKHRLQEIKSRVMVMQLGGAAGTLAALGKEGVQVQEKFAAELGLAVTDIPWHTQRDRIAEIAGWLSLVTGSLAKIAQDIILLAQSEIGEVQESGDLGSGSSSTMPQKHNPITSEYILAAARSNTALLSSIHQALIQENERATHAWQLEMMNLPGMFSLTGGALRNTQIVLDNLVVYPDKMRANIKASAGLMLAEAVSFALAMHMHRDEAKKIVTQACQTAVNEDRHLIDVIRQKTDLALEWDELGDEANYLGSASIFIDAVIEKAKGMH